MNGDSLVTEPAPRSGLAGIAVANAPVSYGAFEITVGIDPNVPDAVTLLDWVAAAGYAGIDLGPVGYLGTGRQLAERLSERGLGLAGGYLGLPFSEPDRLLHAMPQLDALLDIFDCIDRAGHPPRPTLADAGSVARATHPGRAAFDRGVSLDDAGWDRFARGLAVAVDACRNRGYEPSFHHHTATFVEAEWEIVRLLELSDVGLCLDTGHLLLGRGDPVQAIRTWGARINQIHLKDASAAKLEEIVSEGAPVEEIWRRKAFCALGEGDIPIADALAAIDEIGYTGWLVVEQDILPDPADGDLAMTQQQHNREYLRQHGL
ncbi:MAG TPA: sugar phosphate isomerase/epimerase [Solirubrobacteraceae bacterium]